MMMLDDLVPEYPEIPDVHAGVLRDWTWQLRAEMQGQRPGEYQRDHQVAGDDGEVPCRGFYTSDVF